MPPVQPLDDTTAQTKPPERVRGSRHADSREPQAQRQRRSVRALLDAQDREVREARWNSYADIGAA